jgi:hypothetical protein
MSSFKLIPLLRNICDCYFTIFSTKSALAMFDSNISRAITVHLETIKVPGGFLILDNLPIFIAIICLIFQFCFMIQQLKMATYSLRNRVGMMMS